MNEKLDNILCIVLFIVFDILLLIFILGLKDFKDDYDCSTTNDPEWYIKHNCQRYER